MNKRRTQHLFSQVPKVSIQRSVFNRSHSYKTTFDSGKLIPIFVDEVLPGDTFSLNATLFARMATLQTPIMDNLYIDTFFFFVPNRLVWEHWENFCGQQENPSDSTDYLIPHLLKNSKYLESGSIGDYFGIPSTANGNDISALPFRAYWLIWNEWFRDENLQDSVPVSRSDKSEVALAIDNLVNGFSTFTPAPRGKRHDYFTSCLPWPQKGPAVDLPLGTIGGSIDTSNVLFKFRQGVLLKHSDGDDVAYVPGMMSDVQNRGIATASKANNVNIVGSLSGLSFSGSSVGAVTIESLREAFQIQKWYERLARGGSRYTEIVLSMFGVKSPDARLQRPEYLGGSTGRIDISTVAQTSATDNVSPQANLAAFGIHAKRHHGFTKSFTEHGYIIGMCCVRADLTYQQGVNRMWSRRTKFDFYWPTFAHLGEQAVLNKEIYAQGNSADNEVFGYQERYAEYRYSPSLITGKFRSTDPQSLDVWHLAQKFDSLPTLSNQFIQENVPIDRVVAVPSEPQFLLDAYFSLKCSRPMPVYGVPGLVDHF